MSRIALVGGQYGSEGKGTVAQALAPSVDIAIRVGGPNAGHTIHHEGRAWKMRSIPCAWTNPDALLMIGPGAIIDPVVLHEEITALEEAGYSIKSRLLIDERAWIVIGTDRAMDEVNVANIGSTGEGVGPARIRRIEREPSLGSTKAGDMVSLPGSVVDTSLFLGAGSILLEGTQGFGLSLVHGHWPYTTSADCTAAQLFNDCGLFPRPGDMVFQVMRTMPIRVAGTSGPLVGETTWDVISERMGRRVEERTTVTQKVRRIGAWDWPIALRSARVNDPDAVVLTFCDYLDPSIEGETDYQTIRDRPVIADFVREIEVRMHVPVIGLGAGGPEPSIAWSTPFADLLSRYTG